MSFFSIVPREKGFLKDFSNAIPLKVIQSNGIVTKPQLNINMSDMGKGYKHFYNPGSVGITFKISIIINKNEKAQGKLLTDLLDGYIRNMTPLLVHTDAIDIPDTKNNAYIISKNDSRKQEFTNYTEWDLEFMTYNPVTVFKYKNDSKGILQALKKASAHNSKLKKCDYKVLKYSKKKKIVPCVKHMQKILVKNKCLNKKYANGWFGKETKKAVKKFQRNYNKKLVKVSVKNNVANRISVSAGKLIKTKTVTENVTTPSGINVTNKLVNLPANTKLSTKTAKGATTVTLKGLNKILRTDGKVDKATWKVLCKS